MNEPSRPNSEAPKLLLSQARIPADRVFFGSDGLRSGWGIVLFVVLFVSLGSAINFLVVRGEQSFSRGEPRAASSNAASGETSAKHLYASESTPLLAVLLTTFALSRLERRCFTTYGLAGSRRLPHFTQGLVWGFLCLSILASTLHLTGHLPIDGRLLSTAQALRYGAVWAIGFTLVAFLEETLLRGYLQYTLTRGLRAIVASLSDTPRVHAFAFWASAIILSFVFGLGHGSNPGESPIGLLSAGLAGLMFSLALFRTGSLWWALGFHTSWDWAQSFLYGVPDSGAVVQHHFLGTHAVGPVILSGGLTGPEGSIFILPTLALAAAIIVVTLPRTSYSKRP